MDRVFIYILVMALVTYLVRMLPLVLLRREIQNRFIRSFLYYLPYVTLSVMTFPAILTATASVYSAAAGFLAALAAAYRRLSLPLVALSACMAVFIAELVL